MLDGADGDDGDRGTLVIALPLAAVGVCTLERASHRGAS